jgi:hypothetical protein
MWKVHLHPLLTTWFATDLNVDLERAPICVYQLFVAREPRNVLASENLDYYQMMK